MSAAEPKELGIILTVDIVDGRWYAERTDPGLTLSRDPFAAQRFACEADALTAATRIGGGTPVVLDETGACTPFQAPIPDIEYDDDGPF